MTVVMKIDGMMCPHCEARVRNTLSELSCVELAEVSHEKDEAVVHLVSGCEDTSALVSAVEAAGYKVISVN